MTNSLVILGSLSLKDHSKCCGTILRKKRRKRKLSIESAATLALKFVKNDATQYFLQTWEPAFIAWTTFLLATRIASSQEISIVNINTQVEHIDAVINGVYKDNIAPRFGYIRLFDFLECLKIRIQHDKAVGLLQGRNGQKNIAQACNLYRNAQRNLTKPYNLRLYRRIGIRWKRLVGSSPFLLLIFSDIAESITYV